ncbi:hypothetical protein GT147_004225 [Salmonella enterica]|nr:hypothetical protein [Salmonella enterica]EEJ5736451.1 hypothetical protein [Salmonella enterica]EIY0670765.1 hypothetical protein [Salmonella enterica]
MKQTDADIEQANLEHDAALARVAELESELAVLQEVLDAYNQSMRLPCFTKK